MFQLYDLNMNLIEYSNFIRPLDIIISSIGKEIISDSVEEFAGAIRYGSREITRQIQLKFYINTRSMDHFNWARNQIFNLFYQPLYMVEQTFPDRRFLIECIENFTPERLGRYNTDGVLTVPVQTTNLPYAESKVKGKVTGLSIYVDGNVSIEPYRQDLSILIENVQGSNEYLELRNKTNGTHLRITEPVDSTSTILIDGATVKINNAQALRRTDKSFISLSPKMNKLELLGANAANITTMFRNYYR